MDVDLYLINLLLTTKTKKNMNKEVWISVGMTSLAIAIVLVVRDNLPKGSFKFTKG